MESSTQIIYNWIKKNCEKNQENKENLKKIYIQALNNHFVELVKEQQYEKTFTCFGEALALFPADPDIFEVLAIQLNRLEKPIEALNYFDQALFLAPWKLNIVHNRENVVNQWISRWHFAMLNDLNRNEKFKEAISKQLQGENQQKNVLDIGTGTGLLALYAHEAGAKKVFACETNEVMLDIAQKVFVSNKAESIELIPRHSTCLHKLDLGLLSNVDLIITEIFDCGAFGEGVLSTLIHAKEKLLSKNGQILPHSIKIYVAGVSNAGIVQKYAHIQTILQKCDYLKGKFLILDTGDDPYEPVSQINTKLKFVTDPVLGITVDFNNLESLKAAQDGNLDTAVELKMVEDSILEGFLIYFDLFLDSETIISNFELENVEKRTTNCWDPILIPLSAPRNFEKDQILNSKLSCKNGVLSLQHEYDTLIEENSITVNSEVYSFFMDDDYISKLELHVDRLLKQKTDCKHVVADFLPFPHIGIKLLKERKISKLYCTSIEKDLIEKIADLNCISEIVFIDDLDDLAASDLKFNLIIMQPITCHGSINYEQMVFHQQFKDNNLTPDGVIFPYQVDLCGKLIHSAWLDRVTRVQDHCAELINFGISKLLNRYSTKHHYEFENIDSKDFSDIFRISSLHFDDGLHEKDVTVNLKRPENEKKINGIVYFYRIYLADDSENESCVVVTNQLKSFCKVNCFVQNFNIFDQSSSVIVSFVQNQFIFRCEIKNSS